MEGFASLGFASGVAPPLRVSSLTGQHARDPGIEIGMVLCKVRSEGAVDRTVEQLGSHVVEARPIAPDFAYARGET